MTKQTDKDADLIGTIRRAGDFGPIYVVREVHAGTARIQFPEIDSHATATLPTDAVRKDPLEADVRASL